MGRDTELHVFLKDALIVQVFLLHTALLMGKISISEIVEIWITFGQISFVQPCGHF